MTDTSQMKDNAYDIGKLICVECENEFNWYGHLYSERKETPFTTV